MILGIGIDIIDIRRIRKIIDKYGFKFKRRCFSFSEIEKSESRRNSIESYAKREKLIINIGSGAANKSIASWSTYCATKSALDRLTDVIYEAKHKNLKIFSFHPGVVNTNMQNEIRNTKKKFFPLLHKFKSYYKNNELASTEDIAEKIYTIIKNPSKYDHNIITLQDFNIR